MESVDAVPMTGGDGELSYTKNSAVQRRILIKARPQRETAMKTLYTNLFPAEGTAVVVADLGCSNGPNALLVAREFIATIDQIRRDSGHHDWWPEFLVFLNDLPTNDFKTIFRAVPGFQQQLREEMGAGFGSCFIAGVPGSFYGQLFPSQSLHFVHASSCLHWLSQVPEGVEKSKCKGLESFGKAYHEQFRRDFSTFLRYRSEELVTGGCLVFTLRGRESKYPPHHEHCFSSIWLHLQQILTQMAHEGLVDEEKLDTFNQHVYAPSMAEIEVGVKEEGSFAINQVDTFEVNHLDNDNDNDNDDNQEVDGANGLERRIHYMVRSVRCGVEPLLLAHFGKDSPADEVFKRYERIVHETITEEKVMIPMISAFLTKTVRTFKAIRSQGDETKEDLRELHMIQGESNKYIMLPYTTPYKARGV